MVLRLLVVLVGVGFVLGQLHQDAYISTPAIISNQGYPVEKHTALTEDGYTLQLHRIPSGRKHIQTKGPRKVILLISGLLGSSSDFIIMGPKRSLGYLLADEGYDVWIGNLRGDLYTTHTTMKRNMTKFWDYSYHEHGTYDLPATIDKVLSVTQARKLLYIGYSMGTTSYFVMMSMRPEYNEKVVAFVGLAPALYLNNLKPLVIAVKNARIMERMKEQDLHFLYVRDEIRNLLVSSMCQTRRPTDNICLRLMFNFVGEDYDQADLERFPVCMARFQPASLKQLEHFSQLVMSGEFSEYSEELKGKPYNISANRRPVTLFYGQNDKLTEKSQVMRLVDKLKAANTLHDVVKVPWHKFNHLDFVFAKDLYKLMNKNIIKIIPQLFEQYT